MVLKKNGLALTSDIGTRSPMQKWLQKLEWLGLVILLCFPGSILFGQGFDRGNLIFYGMGMGGLGNNSGSIQKQVFNYNFPGYLTFNTVSTDIVSRYLSYTFYTEFTEERTKLSSRGGEIGIEYGIFKYFGIGLSSTYQVISSAKFRTVDSRIGTVSALSSRSVSNQLDLLNVSDAAQLFFQTKRDFYSALTADLNLFYHMNPNSSFDPYLKIGAGYGSENLYGGTINRVFGSLGVRYHFNNRFFISAELEHANAYVVYYKAPSTGYRNKGNYEETAAKIGFGLNFSLSKQDSSNTEEIPKKVIESVASDVVTNSNPVNQDSKLERFVFFASEIFDLPSSRIHLEGRARLDAIARSLENEFKEYDILIITYTSPYKEDLPGNFENYDLGFERAQAISRVLREKGVSPKRIIDSTQGSALYTVESKEKVVIELRKKIK
ncbi:OmpA family protein [Leptospira bouyouniensis]|nr:OmpA family protein [Leptospira bouyouniensis]